MAKKKPDTKRAVPPPAAPVTKRDGTSDASPGTEPEVTDTEVSDEVADGVDPAPDHTALHGIDSVLGDEGVKEYRIVHEGKPYVHVGEWGNQWVYRPA